MSQGKPSHLRDTKEQLRKDVHFLRHKELPRKRDPVKCLSDISGMKFGWLYQVQVCSAKGLEQL